VGEIIFQSGDLLPFFKRKKSPWPNINTKLSTAYTAHFCLVIPLNHFSNQLILTVKCIGVQINFIQSIQCRVHHSSVENKGNDIVVQTSYRLDGTQLWVNKVNHVTFATGYLKDIRKSKFLILIVLRP